MPRLNRNRVQTDQICQNIEDKLKLLKSSLSVEQNIAGREQIYKKINNNNNKRIYIYLIFFIQFIDLSETTQNRQTPAVCFVST